MMEMDEVIAADGRPRLRLAPQFPDVLQFEVFSERVTDIGVVRYTIAGGAITGTLFVDRNRTGTPSGNPGASRTSRSFCATSIPARHG